MVIARPRPIRWLRDHPDRADWLLALVLTAFSTVFHVVGTENLSPSEERDAVWWSIPLSIACTLPVAWRRRHPVEVAVGVTSAQVIFTALDFNGPNFIGVIVALYSLGAHAHGPRRTRALVVTCSMITVLFIAGLFVDELVLADFISSVVVLVTAYVLGDNLRRRRDAAAAMVERAERAERERDLLAHQRVAAERARIARDLHDVVAHSVSAMVIQATAAKRSLATSPDRAAEAIDNIELLGRRAMDELRGTLGVLRASSAIPGDEREGVASTAPQPTLADLEALVAEANDLPISLHLGDDATGVTGAIGLTGYRIVQEALTNVRRHAGDVRRVEVVVERHGGSLVIEVTDDGRGASAGTDDVTDSGYGIRGMQERVDAVGGSVVSEHRVGGGWRVRAQLPTPASTEVAAT